MRHDQIETYQLVSIRKSASLLEASKLMTDCGMGALGVLDEDHRFIGVITERDVLSAVANGVDTRAAHVHQVFNDLPVVIDPPVSREQALEQMTRSRIRHLLVREGDSYRIVSMRDLMSPRHMWTTRTIPYSER